MSVTLMTVRVEVGIPAQTRLCSATGALVTWNSCVRLLCPAPLFPSRNRSAEQTTVQNDPSQLWSDSHVSHIVCASSSSELVSLSLFLAEHLPPVYCTREETMRAREGWAVLPPTTVLSRSLSLASFSPVIVVDPFSFLTLSLQIYCDPDASLAQPLCATPDLWVPKEREECEQLAGLQTIVPGGPLSVVKPPFGSHLSPFFSFSFRLL